MGVSAMYDGYDYEDFRYAGLSPEEAEAMAYDDETSDGFGNVSGRYDPPEVQA
jgi:hypothetical protein